MNRLDRAILALAPGWAAARAAARTRALVAASAHRCVTAYEAAKAGRRTAGWLARAEGPNSAIGSALSRLRDRARQMVRDNPYASRIVAIQAAHQVGWGITPRPMTGDTDLDRRVADLWREFADRADPAGQMDLNGQIAQAARSRAQDGEVLLRQLPQSVATMRGRRLPVPVQIEVMEADYIDDSRTDLVTVSGARSIQGIDIAADGHRLGYWLMRDHPGDGVFASRTGSARVDAGQIIHLMRSYAARPGQVRAVSDLAPVLMRMHALDDYEDAMLEKAKIEAALTAFVKSDAAPGTGPLASTEPTAGGEEREVFFAPGQVNFLNPGESVDFAVPSGVGQFEPLALHFLMSIAIGAGVTYDQLTGDLRQANFSSLRAGKIEFRRVMQQDQYLMLVPQLCTPLWRWFTDAAIVAGKLPERAGGYPVRWSPPPFEMIDPTREIPARIDAIRAGLATPQSEIAADGEDWRETIASYREWNDALDQAGVMLTSDPRRFADTGVAQNAAQNAAIEIGARQPGTPVPRRTTPQPEETP